MILLLMLVLQDVTQWISVKLHLIRTGMKVSLGTYRYWGRLWPLEGVGLGEVRASPGPPCTGKCLLPLPRGNSGSCGLWQRFKGPCAVAGSGDDLKGPGLGRRYRPGSFKSPPQPCHCYPRAPATGLWQQFKGPGLRPLLGAAGPLNCTWGSRSTPLRRTGSCQYAVPGRTSLLSPLLLTNIPVTQLSGEIVE
ncbi:hypothetical protein UY3_07617 [Chelonia mydas]|uniref:Uncharacterized protein n=1 Tax=Chelonia mydas TaxID=8469 RepID=M7C465_CHEMY|nr:hypothetical protein UY3_07617 [Chelonia mydas]